MTESETVRGVADVILITPDHDIVLAVHHGSVDATVHERTGMPRLPWWWHVSSWSQQEWDLGERWHLLKYG